MNRRSFFRLAAGVLGALAIPVPKVPKVFLPLFTRQVTLREVAKMYPQSGNLIEGGTSHDDPFLPEIMKAWTDKVFNG